MRGPLLPARQAVSLLALAASVVLPLGAAEPANSVFLVSCASQAHRFDVPWEKQRPQQGLGTAFLVGERTILTNAHVVSDAVYVELAKRGDDRRHVARVAHIAHDCDLAVLAVEDEAFFDDTEPLELGDLPEVDSEVTTWGFPLGGTQVSVTRGVVSRVQQWVYAHSGCDAHLVIQTDAAINPGNSGGPVLQDGAVVGMAFQGMLQADNIGYMIPALVIRHFLEDVKDGRVDGFGEIGVGFRPDLQNPMVRAILKVPKGESGVVVTRVFPGMPAWGKLQPLDVLLAIQGHRIGDDGLIRLEGRTVDFPEVMERLQAGTEITLRVLRDARALEVRLPLRRWDLVVPHAHPWGVAPAYYIYGGLCFTPLSNGYLMAKGGVEKAPLAVRHLYEEGCSREEALAHKEFPVLALRLPDMANAGSEPFVDQVLESVEGKAVTSLAGLKQALDSAPDGFVTLRFLGMKAPLVLSTAEARAAGPAILKKYRIPAGERL